MVKYIVKIGSMHFEAGTFKAGDVIDVSEERAKLFDQLDIRRVEQINTDTPTLNVEKTSPVNIAITEVKPTFEATPTTTTTENHSPIVGRKRRK